MAGVEAAILKQALTLGFDAAGIARPEDVAGAGAGLSAYLAAGHHGTMEWMAKNASRRRRPEALWPEVKSIVAVAMNYGPGHRPGPQPSAAAGGGQVAAYARGNDYHKVMMRPLKRLGTWIADRHGGRVKVFVDTAPVLEKPIAERAGLGWQGKHTNLVSREFGSWLLLGEVFTTLDLEPGEAGEDECGTCTRCLDICPTDAFPAPYQLDSRRCISYLTIEYKGHIAEEFRQAIGERVFGCDECLAVCPWNKFAQAAHETALWPRIELTAPRLADFAALDDAGFRRVFAGSPIKRTGRDRFVRNVLIAIGNTGDRGLTSPVLGLLDDPSPLVRAMAVWALGRLDGRAFAREKVLRLGAEHDDAVRAEWIREAMVRAAVGP